MKKRAEEAVSQLDTNDRCSDQLTRGKEQDAEDSRSELQLAPTEHLHAEVALGNSDGTVSKINLPLVRILHERDQAFCDEFLGDLQYPYSTASEDLMICQS